MVWHLTRADIPRRVTLRPTPSRHTARLRTSGLPPQFSRSPVLSLRYLSTSLLWWQAVVGILGGISSHALRMNAPCTWRRRTGLPHVYNTAIRRALSPLRLCGSVTAAVHGCPRGVAPLRPARALRDTPVARPGGSNNPLASPFHGMRCPPASPLVASWPWPRHHAIRVGTH